MRPPTPMTTRTTTLAGGVLLCGLLAGITPLASAQTAPATSSGTAPGSPVDATVADLDPRAASLRRVEPGNAQFSFEARLTVADFYAGWSPFNPATPTATDPRTGLVHSQGYQYRSPGLRALIDRPEYARLRDGGELMIIPANTVFQLTLDQPAQPADPRPAAHDNYRDQRLNLHASDATSSAHDPFNPATASGLAYPNLRLERIPVGDLSPIPDASQMRFPQAAFPQNPPPSQPLVPVRRPRVDDTPAPSPATEASEPPTPSDESLEASEAAEASEVAPATTE